MKSLSQTASLLLVSTFAINLLSVSTASAEIFKCTNSKGKIYYNDKACPTNQKEKKLNAVKDPVNGYVPPAIVAAEAVEKAKKKVKEIDLFGTPQYKGKETKKMHDARVAHEKNMELREKIILEEAESKKEYEAELKKSEAGELASVNTDGADHSHDDGKQE